jgi:hypothetical protein
MVTRQERCHGGKVGKGSKLRSSRRELLVSASLWCQHVSGASPLLVSAKSWCQPAPGGQQSPGARKVSGVSMAGVSMACPFITMALVSPDFWYEIFWCQEFMFATRRKEIQ